MKTRNDLFNYLDTLNITTKTTDHEPLFTVEQADEIAHNIPGGHIKNLFLKDDNKQFWLLVADAHARIELKQVAHLLKAPKLRFADANLLLQYLGVTPGSVTPLALINDTDQKVTVVIDQSLWSHDILNMHPLENSATTSINSNDFKQFLQATKHEPISIDLNSYRVVS